MHSCPGPGTGLALSDSHHRRLLHYLATPTPTPVKKEPFVLDVGSDFCKNNNRLCWLLSVGFFLGLAVLVAHVMSCHLMSRHVGVVSDWLFWFWGQVGKPRQRKGGRPARDGHRPAPHQGLFQKSGRPQAGTPESVLNCCHRSMYYRLAVLLAFPPGSRVSWSNETQQRCRNRHRVVVQYLNLSSLCTDE